MCALLPVNSSIVDRLTANDWSSTCGGGVDGAPVDDVDDDDDDDD